MPNNSEITAERDRATGKLTRQESDYPEQSYEAGVENALNWILGETDDPPMADER